MTIRNLTRYAGVFSIAALIGACDTNGPTEPAEAEFAPSPMGALMQPGTPANVNDRFEEVEEVFRDNDEANADPTAYKYDHYGTITGDTPRPNPAADAAEERRH